VSLRVTRIRIAILLFNLAEKMKQPINNTALTWYISTNEIVTDG
jgi:hypothetical protein